MVCMHPTLSYKLASKHENLVPDDCPMYRQRSGAEAKLEVAAEVTRENKRLQEKLHSYRKEVRRLEASRHARSDEYEVLQAQLRCVLCS